MRPASRDSFATAEAATADQPPRKAVKAIDLCSTNSSIPNTTASSRCFDQAQTRQSHHELLRRPLALTSPLPPPHLQNPLKPAQLLPRPLIHSLFLLTRRQLLNLVLQTPPPRQLHPIPAPQAETPDTRSLGLCAQASFQSCYGCCSAIDQCWGRVA